MRLFAMLKFFEIKISDTKVQYGMMGLALTIPIAISFFFYLQKSVFDQHTYLDMNHPWLSFFSYISFDPFLAVIILQALIIIAGGFIVKELLEKQYGMLFIILSLTPAFYHIVLGQLSFAIALLLLLGIMLCLKKGKTWHLIGVILQIALVLINALFALIGLTVILYTVYTKQTRIRTGVLYTFPLAAGTITSIFQHKPIPTLLLADVGGTMLSVSLIVLAFFGILMIQKKERAIGVAIIAAIVILFVDYEVGGIVLGLLAAYFAAKVITSLINQRWYFADLKAIAIVLIFCSLGLPTGSMIVERFEQERLPLEVLSHLFGEKVATDYQLGNQLMQHGAEVIMNSDFRRDSAAEQYADLTIIFESRSIQRTSELLNKHQVTYILITPTMREQIWENKNQGLLFLLATQEEKFIEIYNDGAYVIWEYVS